MRVIKVSALYAVWRCTEKTKLPSRKASFLLAEEERAERPCGPPGREAAGNPLGHVVEGAPGRGLGQGKVQKVQGV